MRARIDSGHCSETRSQRVSRTVEVHERRIPCGRQDMLGDRCDQVPVQRQMAQRRRVRVLDSALLRLFPGSEISHPLREVPSKYRL